MADGKKATKKSGTRHHVRKPDEEADPEFQIAPMIDILLVLLVFFMSISSTEVLQSNQEVELPVAIDAKATTENPGQVILNMTYNEINNVSGIEINERAYSMAELVPFLQNYIQKSPMGRVLIRADKGIRYEELRGVLEAIGQAGVGSITFSVIDRELE